MSITWLPIEQCPKQRSTMYLVSGWCYGKPGTEERWYDVAMFVGGKWLDDEANDLYAPTHFAFFNPVE